MIYDWVSGYFGFRGLVPIAGSAVVLRDGCLDEC